MFSSALFLEYRQLVLSFHCERPSFTPTKKKVKLFIYIYILMPQLNIVRVIKSRRMRWAGHVARMGEERGRIGSWWGNRRGRDHWRDLGVDGWIILGWISRRWDVGMWTGLGWPRIGTGGGRL